jgi:predicted nucleotidyltransferase
MDAIRDVLEGDGRVAYALLFGSSARGDDRTGSDADVAVGLTPGTRLSAHDIGDLVSRLESATARTVDLLILDEAPPAIAYRVFRDGVELVVRDRAALVGRKARAILEYLDFRPIEELCASGVLAAARGRQSRTR